MKKQGNFFILHSLYGFKKGSFFSDHVSSEELCKSSDITTPPGSMTSSLEPLSIDVIKVDQEKIYSSKIDKNETSFDTSKLPCQHPQTFVTQSEEIQPPADKDGVVTEGEVRFFSLNLQTC